MTDKMAFAQWMEQNALTIDGQNAVGYIPAPYGITILMRNGTGIPYPYLEESARLLPHKV